MLRFGGRRLLLAGVVVAVGLLVAGGVAYATIPDSGVIHGCYQKADGQLRVVDPQKGGACRDSEQALDWSQTGPQGPAGPQGPKGDTGPQGPAGGLNQIESEFAVGAPGSDGFATAEVDCPPGTIVTGGGGDIVGTIGDESGFGPRIVTDHPASASSWLVTALAPEQWLSNGLNARWEVEGYALCAKAS